MSEATEKPFFDLSATDIIGAYLEKEKNDSEAKARAVEAQAATQAAALHQPTYQAGEAVSTGYVQAQPMQRAANYWGQIPKPLLYGSLGLLGVALLAKVVR